MCGAGTGYGFFDTGVDFADEGPCAGARIVVPEIAVVLVRTVLLGVFHGVCHPVRIAV